MARQRAAVFVAFLFLLLVGEFLEHLPSSVSRLSLDYYLLECIVSSVCRVLDALRAAER
jgi:hypothetical protein